MQSRSTCWIIVWTVGFYHAVLNEKFLMISTSSDLSEKAFYFTPTNQRECNLSCINVPRPLCLNFIGLNFISQLYILKCRKIKMIKPFIEVFFSLFLPWFLVASVSLTYVYLSVSQIILFSFTFCEGLGAISRWECVFSLYIYSWTNKNEESSIMMGRFLRNEKLETRDINSHLQIRM